MKTKKQTLVEKLIENKKIFFSLDELENILSFSEIIFEEDTLISDKIRILKLDDKIIVQEKTDKNEIALHLLADEKNATEFVNKRLETYEKMWDGCGCKVHYYEE